MESPAETGPEDAGPPTLFLREGSRFNPPLVNPGPNDAAEFATRTADFVEQFKWLIEPANVAFYMNNHWEMVPEEWREPLLTLTDDELKALPERMTPEMRGRFPASLINMLDTAYSLQMPRQLGQILSRLKPSTNVADLNTDVELSLFYGNAVTKADLPFSYLLARGMSPKKIHEVTRMSKLVVELCKALGVDTVVDIGAGEGYVSHVLSQHYGYRVIAVEGNSDYSRKGEARVQSITTQIRWRVTKSGGSVSEPHFMVYNLTDDSISSFEDSVQQAIKQAISKEKALAAQSSPAEDAASEEKSEYQSHKYILIGLHTCGDLAHKVIDLFLQSSHAVGLIGIGCCYQLTTSLIGAHATIDYGTPLSIYPRSSLLKARRFRLGWGGLKIATESCYQYSHKQGKFFTHVHHSLSLRAILELIIRKYYPEGHREGKHPKDVWQNALMHAEYGPGNWQGSGREMCEDCGDETSVESKTTAGEKAHPEKAVSSPLTLKKLEYIRDIKVRFRFKKLRLKDYDSEELYLTQSIKRFIIKTEDSPKWRPVDFGPFMAFKEIPMGKEPTEEEKRELEERNQRRNAMMQEMMALVAEYAPREREVAVWAALQMLLNPLIESLLLLDRLLYIEEFKCEGQRQGQVRAELLPLFDVVHSPRNVAIVAHKAIGHSH